MADYSGYPMGFFRIGEYGPDDRGPHGLVLEYKETWYHFPNGLTVSYAFDVSDGLYYLDVEDYKGRKDIAYAKSREVLVNATDGAIWSWESEERVDDALALLRDWEGEL